MPLDRGLEQQWHGGGEHRGLHRREGLAEEKGEAQRHIVRRGGMRDSSCQHSCLEQPLGPEEGGSRDCQLKAQTQLEGDVGSSQNYC